MTMSRRSRSEEPDLITVLFAADEAGAPDVSDVVMHRLGYVRADAATIRRARRLRSLRRVMITLVLTAGAGVAFNVYRGSAAVRDVGTINFERALADDIERQGGQIRSVVDALRPRLEVLPTPVHDRVESSSTAPAVDEAESGDDEILAVGPFGWV